MKGKKDAIIVRQCLKGNTESFGTLVDRYQKPIFNAAYRLTSSYEEAQDITQTVFIKAFEKLDTFDDRHPFFSWLYRIAVNESLNSIKRQGRFKDVSGVFISKDRTPAEKCEVSELSQVFQLVLMELDVNYRIVIILKHFLDCSYREMSRILDIPEKTVKSRLFTARKLLKDQLTNKGVVTK